MKTFKRLILLIACIFLASNIYNCHQAHAEEVAATDKPNETTEEGVIMDGLSKEDEDKMAAAKESFTFQAEVSRLMDIIINSLYKNKEVFLRELISNASDALDKLRFLAVSNPDMLGDTKDMSIKISFNEKKKTLTIRDTGIGMTRHDLVNNLGTLAKSGTKSFLEAMTAGGDMSSSLIGQFGVGFYSVYLVADKVRVVTKHNDEEQYIWESSADQSFTITPDPRGNTLGRGTEITIFMKDDASEYLGQHRLEEVVKRHSEFITFPISLLKKTTETIEVPDPDAVEEEEEEKPEKRIDENGLEIEEGEEDPAKEEKKPKTKTEKVDKWEWERLNGNVAIWSRDKDEITDEEYKKFFRVISKDAAGDTNTWIHFKAEGEVEFKSILYIPKESMTLYDEYSNRKAGIRLYVRRVLIQDDFEELLPRYMNFIKGVVDSDDLPLNVSRETLQQHRILKIMGKKLVRKVLELLRKIATGKTEDGDSDTDSKLSLNDPEHPYIKFWEQFGKSIKMGVMDDPANRSKLSKLLRYKTTKSDDKYISLEDYLERKPEWQKEIYYVAAESMEAAKKSPFLEVANRKGIEVLYMFDPIDEYCIQNLGDFDGHKIQSLTKEGVKFGDEDEDTVKKRTKAYRENFKPLTKFLKELLSGKVSKVTVSQRVEKSPSIIVTSQYGHTANMERIIRSQTFANPEAYKHMLAQKTLELNPRHPVIIELNKLVKDSAKKDTQETKDLGYLVYDTALLASGFQHDDLENFSDRMTRALASIMDVESLELADELMIESEEEEEEEENLDSNPSHGSGDHDEF